MTLLSRGLTLLLHHQNPDLFSPKKVFLLVSRVLSLSPPLSVVQQCWALLCRVSFDHTLSDALLALVLCLRSPHAQVLLSHASAPGLLQSVVVSLSSDAAFVQYVDLLRALLPLDPSVSLFRAFVEPAVTHLLKSDCSTLFLDKMCQYLRSMSLAVARSLLQTNGSFDVITLALLHQIRLSSFLK